MKAEAEKAKIIANAEKQAQEIIGIRITPVPDDGADLLYALRGTED